MRRIIALIALASILIALVGCGLSREDAAHWANEFCKPHGGVNTKSQNGFYYADQGEASAANVTCADGTVGADQ